MMSESNKNHIASECFRKGTEAMNKQNWDYAIDMFRKAILLVPDNRFFRESLRGVEKRKYQNNKSGAKMAGLRLSGIRARIMNARRKKNWKELDQAAEDGLAINPWDAQLNADLGEACHNLGLPDVAMFAYDNAVGLDPNNKSYNEQYANLLELRGSYQEAIQCWQRIRKIDPNDNRARTKITQLEASSVMDRGGYNDASTTQEVRTGYDFDRPVKQVLPESIDGPGKSLEADLLHAIRKDQANKDNYLKLADLYRKVKQLDDAENMLKTALDISGGDANIREQLEDVQIDQIRQNYETAKHAASSDPQDEVAHRNHSELRRELREREIAVYSSRVDRYPKDGRMKLKLANLFMRTKDRWRKAIPLLQKIVNDRRLELEARVSLARCFIADENTSLASHQLDAVIPKINSHDHPELFVDAHYLLGRLCEDAGKAKDAESHYTEILGVDYEYKDARIRLEKLQDRGAAGDSKSA